MSPERRCLVDVRDVRHVGLALAIAVRTVLHALLYTVPSTATNWTPASASLLPTCARTAPTDKTLFCLAIIDVTTS